MLLFAKSIRGQTCGILPQLINRHGLITGATGTGKTISLQVLAERISAIGVPVFLADIKGDLSGLAAAGASSSKLEERLAKISVQNWQGSAFPVTLWDVFGEQGHPVRATISDMGPLLISRLLDLNEVQSGVLQLVFKIADDCGQLLLDLKDLRAMLQYIGDNRQDFASEYGNIAPASVGTIQRGLLNLSMQGGDVFFGEPMLNIDDLMHVESASGRGMINILQSAKLVQSPRIYATFLLWLLSELYERLPEVGDLDKPKLVFFFDEAHLLFNEAPKVLLDKVEQVVRLVRSKGVGIYFVTQNPLDIPDSILGQLGNRVQHALRAFTPRDQKAVATAADTMCPNPAFNTRDAIMNLAVGEALVSFLDSEGRPTPVERCWVLPPQSRIGPLTAAEQQYLIEHSAVHGTYETVIDRYSAYEMIKGIKPDATAVTDYPAAATDAASHTIPQTGANDNSPNQGNVAGTNTAAAAGAGSGAAVAGAMVDTMAGAAIDQTWGNSASSATSATSTVRSTSATLPLPGTAPPNPSVLPGTNQGGILDTLSNILGDASGGGRRESVIQAAAKSMARSVGSQVGQAVVRGILGSILGGRRR